MNSAEASATRYGWVVVAALTLLLGCTHGLISSGISVFDPAILGELGVTRGALKLRDVFQLFGAGIWALVIGFLAARVGPRTIIYIGLVLLALVLSIYSQVRSVEQIYLLHLLLAFCYSSCHVVVVLLVLTRWFALRRNTALGIILAGESLGGTIFPQIVVWLVAHVGWRGAMQWLALMPVVLIALMALVMRESPEKMGRKPFGWLPGVAGQAEPNPGVRSEGTGRILDQLLRREVMIVIFTVALIFYAGGGIAAHTFLFFRDKGVDAGTAAAGLSLFYGAALVGKSGSGILSERWRVLDLWVAFQVVMLAGAIAITIDADGWPFVVIACLGLGWGGCYTLSQALMMQRFEGPYLAQLSGITVLVEGFTAGMGSFGSGMLFDRFGSYTVAFGLMVALLMISILSSLSVRSHARRPAALTPAIANADIA